MMLTAIDLATKYPLETAREIREGLSGSLCRCTGYQDIGTSVLQAVKQTRAKA